ncbi:MAG: hypothetical protein ACPG8W_00665 [Candidatus Promineifilaceae bacterium]
MNDSNTPPLQLDEGDLFAYLDDDASPRVVQRIEQDEALLAQVEALRQMQTLFGLSLAQHHCPSTDDLLEYQANLLQGDAHRSVAQHLVTCTYCQAEMHDLAVEIVLEKETKPISEPGWREILEAAGRRLVDLTSRPQVRRPAYALRGNVQQVLFESAEFQVIISIKKLSDQQIRFEGQVMNLSDPLTMPNGNVTLRIGEASTQTSVLDEFGHFQLKHTATDTYSLQIDIDGATSLVASIEIGG